MVSMIMGEALIHGLVLYPCLIMNEIILFALVNPVGIIMACPSLLFDQYPPIIGQPLSNYSCRTFSLFFPTSTNSHWFILVQAATNSTGIHWFILHRGAWSPPRHTDVNGARAGASAAEAKPQGDRDLPGSWVAMGRYQPPIIIAISTTKN